VGPDTGKHVRNIAIILVLAVIVWQVPGGGDATNTINNVLGIIFLGGLLLFGYRIYMENRDTIFGLPERNRGVMYASLALATITLVATSRMWNSGGLGAVLWLAFISAAVFGLFSVWRAYREY
jgi:TRAP-type C4-dicarboxylate transport system permease small subunit